MELSWIEYDTLIAIHLFYLILTHVVLGFFYKKNNFSVEWVDSYVLFSHSRKELTLHLESSITMDYGYISFLHPIDSQTSGTPFDSAKLACVVETC